MHKKCISLGIILLYFISAIIPITFAYEINTESSPFYLLNDTQYAEMNRIMDILKEDIKKCDEGEIKEKVYSSLEQLNNLGLINDNDFKLVNNCLKMIFFVEIFDKFYNTLDDKNIFCFVVGKVYHAKSLKHILLFDDYYEQFRSIGPHVNSFLSFGEFFWSTDGIITNLSARGFVETYGLFGTKTWEGAPFWGNLGQVYQTGGIGMSQWHQYYFLGAKHFTGIMIPWIWVQDGKLVFGDLIFGLALRVSITHDFPLM